MKKIISFLLCMSTVFAIVTLISPTPMTLNDVSNYIGDIAPGQTVELVFSRLTGEEGESKAIFWEKATAETLETESELQGDKISLKIKIPENVLGEFTFPVKFEGTELELITPEIKPITVHVRNNVYSVDYKEYAEMYAGKTTDFSMYITSNSIASDSFEIISTEGLPSGWVKKEAVYVPAFAKSIPITMKITPFEEGYYPAKLNLKRESSSTITPIDVGFRVYPTFDAKLKSYSEGFSIVPIILQPFYSLLSLFGWA